MNIISAYLGEFMALAAAVSWAFAVILFKKSGETVHPIGLNLFKDVLAALLFLPSIWISTEVFFRDVPVNDYLLLLISGALGIGIADTLFFKSLNVLGAGLSAIVDCLYSPFIIGLSILWLNESLTGWQFFGTVLIVSAVLTALGNHGLEKTDRKRIMLGVFWGASAMAIMALGVVIVKPVLDRSPLLWSTEIRLIGGIIILIPMSLFHPARKQIFRSVISCQRWAYMLSGSFVGGYLSMVIWLAGMKYTQASIAAALNQTTNIFIFILAAWLLHEKITRLKLLGIVLGVTGACLVTFG